ncbi:transcriptional activator domain-containing protein [Proteiniborus sp. DW1]|uniref:AfsR/SARP family transcriptional regulator n=1 Tax=Proteiniborus sp. DW1 TaxID=1889883 RepID=UPI00092E0ED0|nr:BTAD domain-containing putative transcriptional regulator [Proteiniborus sp. DW1]SCG81781.1 transcriptional activator domain-containing protein [Proteiniborus sp. DW1]
MLYIKTFGYFDIRLDGKSLLEGVNRSYKIFRLFEYLLTFRGKKLLPESIVENLWQDNEYTDPRSALRLQIFRLKKMLDKILPDVADTTKYYRIKFSNGYYCFELGEQAILDAEEFHDYIEKGDSIETDEAIELYKKALKLYNGPYLADNSYEMWLVPVRNHYNRLYIKTLLKLLEILKGREEYSSIIELCEDAINMEPYEEIIHIYLMEAMLKLGFIKEALDHYEYITSLLYKEMRVSPSLRLKSIYRKIKGYYSEKKEVTIDGIREKLEEDNYQGALLCDSDTFKVLLNLQKRKGLRDEVSDFIGLITLDPKDNDEYSEKDIKNAVKVMTRVLEKSLRKGDVFSLWNDSQAVAILHKAKEDGLNKIGNRIRKNFYNNIQENKYRISIKFLPLTSKNNVL